MPGASATNQQHDAPCLYAAGRSNGRTVDAGILSNDALTTASSAGAAAGNQRSWQLLEKVLTRTCAAWQSVDAVEQQLVHLQKQQAVLEMGAPCQS